VYILYRPTYIFCVIIGPWPPCYKIVAGPMLLGIVVAELLQAGCPSCHPTSSVKALKDDSVAYYRAKNEKTRLPIQEWIVRHIHTTRSADNTSAISTTTTTTPTTTVAIVSVNILVLATTLCHLSRSMQS